jgi:hypothetical protein
MSPKAHIKKLCAVLGIRLNMTARNTAQCFASRKYKSIRIFPVKCQITYAIALHEIGHLIGNKLNNVLDEELRAWANAKRLSKYKWNRQIMGVMRDSFESHYLDYGPKDISNRARNVMAFFKKNRIKKVNYDLMSKTK